MSRLRQISTRHFNANYGGGMAGISYRSWGFQIIDNRRWGPTTWSRIRFFNIPLGRYRLEVKCGRRSEPYRRSEHQEAADG